MIEYQRIGDLWRATVTINGVTIGSAQMPTQREAVQDLMDALSKIRRHLDEMGTDGRQPI